MHPESEKFNPIKSYFAKKFTVSNKPLKLKVHKDKRMRQLLLESMELTNVPLTLFNPDRSFINCGVGQSSAVDDVLKVCQH